jgi:hypothetical protein
MNDNPNTNDTTPATESQHPRTNEGACELNAAQVAFLSKATSDCSHLTASRIFGDMEHETYTMLGGDDKKALMLAYENWNQNGNIAPDDLKAIEAGYFSGQAWAWSAYVAHLLPQLVDALAAEQAAHALDMETFATGSRMNAAVLDSTRACITEIVDAVKADWIACSAYNASQDSYTLHEWVDTHKHAVAMVEKHEGAGVSEDERISVEALAREGFTKMEPDDDHTLEYWRNGKVCVMFHVTTPPSVWVENGWYDWKQDGVNVELDVVAVDNCTTKREFLQLVRLFTAPDAARARDEG